MNTKQTTPFKVNSMLWKAWNLALKGTTLRELTKQAEKEGANLVLILRTLRKGIRKEWTWQVQEESGRFKLYNVKRTIVDIKEN